MSEPVPPGAYLVLSTWEEVITQEYLDKVKASFFNGFIENSEHITNLDNKKGRINYYDNFSGTYIEDSFERKIVALLQLENKKNAINALLITLSGKPEKIGLINYLKSTIKSLIKERRGLFLQYGLIRSELKKLIDFLDHRHGISVPYPFIELDEKQKQQTQILTLKRQKTKHESKKIENALIGLYFLLIRYQIIEEFEDEENYITQEDFINTVKGKKTNTPITLIANTNFAVHAIDAYKDIYDNYNAGLVEKSKIYKTKKDFFLTQINYNTSLLRKPKGREAEIEEMRLKIKNLFI